MTASKKLANKNTHTGKTVKAFWSDESFWVKDMYTDDLLLRVNGQEIPDFEIETLQDTDSVEFASGTIFSDYGVPPEHVLVASKNKHIDINEGLALWLNGQSSINVILTCDKDVDLTALAAHLAAFHPSIKMLA